MTVFSLESLQTHDVRKSLQEKTAQAELVRRDARFKIFMSYQRKDEGVALVAARQLFNAVDSISIYVDKFDSGLVIDSKIDSETANRLRQQIQSSDALFYFSASKTTLGTSRWTPWELGVADGASKRVGILPALSRSERGDGWTYKGEEYLGLYPWIDLHNDTTGTPRIWANGKVGDYMEFEAWMNGEEPRIRLHLGLGK